MFPGPGTVPNVLFIGAGQPVPRPARCGHAGGMRANVGDLLVVPGLESRVGLVIRVLGPDGTPPYVIKWQSDGHIAMVTPGEYSRIVPAWRGDAHGGVAGADLAD